MRARPPVPAPFTTRNRPSCSALTVSRLELNARLRRRRAHRHPSAAVIDRLQQLWDESSAAVGNRRHHHGERDRRNRHLSLTDRHRDRFASVPLFVVAAPFPFGRGHQPFDLVGQIDAGLLAEAEQRRPTCGFDRLRACCRRCSNRCCTTARSHAAGPAEPCAFRHWKKRP